MNIKDNSKKINKGDIFIALGSGHKYIEEAIKNGASKVIAEYGDYEVETLIVKDTRKYLIKYLKDNYYAELKDMNIIGITGTNGKTTTAFLIYQALNLLNSKCAYIGTIGFFIDDKVCELDNTTPDIIDLYEMIIMAKNRGCKNIVMEVSSHSLSLKRVDALKFDYVLFTNLTNDHLNYHRTMNKYFNAKKKLIKLLKKDGKKIVNIDDKYMKKLRRNSLTIGKNGKYKTGEYKFTSKTIFSLNDTRYEMSLLGLYNIYNMSFCIALLESMGFKNFKNIIRKLKAPSGRMEIINFDDKKFIVDYAHTPDAVEKIINAVKSFAKNKIYVIIGCGGNRDRTKRTLMAKVATSLADYAIFTTDNPRFEEPTDIINDMIDGLSNTNYQVVVNREEAIKKGIQLLENNDILLVLGKGHEKYQIIKDEKIHFDDIEIIKTNIRR